MNIIRNSPAASVNGPRDAVSSAIRPLNILIGCECSGRVRDAAIDLGHNAWSCDLLGPDSLDSGLSEDAWIAEWHAQKWPNYHLEGDVRWWVQAGPEQADAGPHAKTVPGGGSWDVMIAHPDCTRLTNAGVRWLFKPNKNGKGHSRAKNKTMWAAMIEAANFYVDLWLSPVPMVVLENPVMHGYAMEAIWAEIQRRRRFLPEHMRYLCNTNPAAGRQFVQPYMFGDSFSKKTGFAARNYLYPEKARPIPIPDVFTWAPAPWVEECHNMSPGPDRWYWRSKTYPGIARALALHYGGKIRGRSDR